MAAFVPFRALRYPSTTDLDAVTAPPYDVLSEVQVAELRARDPHNIVHVDVPAGGGERYESAARILSGWVADGTLVADPEPSFTIYRLRFTDASGTARDIAGVLGGLQVLDPDDRSVPPVLPHERTTPKASTDRLDLTRATRANLSPVWGLSLASGLTALLAEPGEPLGRVVDEGVEHVVERVTDPERVAAIAELIGSDAVLIADGHHRYGVARTYRDETRAGGQVDSPAEQTLTFVNELVADQLSVEAIHRLYDEDPATLGEQLSPRFQFSEIARPTPATLAAMVEEGFLVLVGPHAAWRLDPRPGAFDDVRALDGAWLEAAVDPGVPVSYQHGLDETLAAVESGDARAAVLIRPVSVAEIERTAREGLLMPPKSTFFTPKLKTGLVVRSLSA